MRNIPLSAEEGAPPKIKIIRRIHREAMTAAKEFKEKEMNLLKVLQRVDEYKVFRALGYGSLLSYARNVLGLQRSTALDLINVARKSMQIPALLESVEKKEISLRKARRICSVITHENQEHWINLAKSNNQRNLEREIRRVNPKLDVHEGAQYVNEQIMEFKAALTEEVFELLESAKKLLNQKKGQSVSWEEVLQEVATLFLEKNDPVRKAKRAQKRKGENTEAKQLELANGVGTCRTKTHRRKALSAQVRHQIYLRDKSQCRYIEPNGKRCENRTFLHFHHVKPLQRGGADSVENIISVCANHHVLIHEQGQHHIKT